MVWCRQTTVLFVHVSEMGPAKKATTMVGRLCSAPFKPWYICSTTELIMAFCLSLFDTLLHLLHIHKILVCCIALPLTLYGQTTMLVLLLFPTWTPATSFWVSIWTSGKSSRLSQIEELWPRFTWLWFNWFCCDQSLQECQTFFLSYIVQ